MRQVFGSMVEPTASNRRVLAGACTVGIPAGAFAVYNTVNWKEREPVIVNEYLRVVRIKIFLLCLCHKIPREPLEKNGQ